ncbi:acetyltransferase [alpha proteobacterium U9-1i]|nr:acetyltransferase [alpha proteobacterium U9-1i]
MNHPLDKPIWSALASRQAHFAVGGDLARAFPADVSPFAAARDGAPEAVDALAALVPAEADISLLEVSPPQAPPHIAATELVGVQMVLNAFPAGGAKHNIVALGDADAEEMLALALLTKPGPFRTRTHKMGRFIGIRDGSRLVAMGGERLALDGFTEVTALCTHPDYRGRGYGEALLRAVGKRIIDDGLTPFLHVYASNTGAIALYQRMGFAIRANVTHAIWKRAP